MDYKKTVLRLAIVVLLLPIFLIPSITHAELQTAQKNPLEKEIKALEDTIRLLEDKEETKKIVAQLTLIVDAKHKVLSKKKTEKKKKGEVKTPLVFTILSNLKTGIYKLKNIPTETNRFLNDIQATYGSWNNFFKEKKNLYRFIAIISKIFILLLIGLILWSISSKISRKIKPKSIS